MMEFKFSDEEKHTAAKREVAMRKRVYPGWVAAGRMKLDMAEYQIAVMQEIADEYAVKESP